MAYIIVKKVVTMFGKSDYLCMVHAILLKPPRGPTPSVLASLCFAWPRKSHVENRPGHLLLFYHMKQ